MQLQGSGVVVVVVVVEAGSEVVVVVTHSHGRGVVVVGSALVVVVFEHPSVSSVQENHEAFQTHLQFPVHCGPWVVVVSAAGTA